MVSVVLSQRKIQTYKRVVFPGEALNSPTVFLGGCLCVHFVLHQPHPQIIQAKRHHKGFTFELFWTFFYFLLAGIEVFQVPANSHTRGVGITWLESLLQAQLLLF
jgi:hypothetical protein